VFRNRYASLRISKIDPSRYSLYRAKRIALRGLFLIRYPRTPLIRVSAQGRTRRVPSSDSQLSDLVCGTLFVVFFRIPSRSRA